MVPRRVMLLSNARSHLPPRVPRPHHDEAERWHVLHQVHEREPHSCARRWPSLQPSTHSIVCHPLRALALHGLVQLLHELEDE
jgi:hypothetical protein